MKFLQLAVMCFRMYLKFGNRNVQGMRVYEYYLDMTVLKKGVRNDTEFLSTKMLESVKR